MNHIPNWATWSKFVFLERVRDEQLVNCHCPIPLHSTMPVEPTNAMLKRRISRRDLDEYQFDGSYARELELKRSKGSYP